MAANERNKRSVPPDGVSARGRSLWSEDSGAVMVIGVFMAMLVTGFLYYIIGIGNTILYRERMQDAADSIAFAGAVMHARAMNLVALINIILAMLMAVWITLRMVQTVLLMAIVFCSVPPGAVVCGGAVPTLVAAERMVDRIQNAYLRGVLEPALRAGHLAQDGIRVAWPALAYGRVVVDTISGGYRPPVEGGTLLPVPPRSLPLKTMRLRTLCEHAAGYTLFPWLLSMIPGIGGPVGRFVSRVIGTLFCPYSLDRNEFRPYEIDPGDGSCNDGMPGQNCEYVQLRGVVFSTSTPFSRNERGVRIANWGRGAGGSALSVLRPFTQLSVAQAEYYFEGTQGRGEWVWHMNWRARMRRFRLGTMIRSIPGLGGVDLSVIDSLMAH